MLKIMNFASNCLISQRCKLQICSAMMLSAKLHIILLTYYSTSGLEKNNNNNNNNGFV